MQEFGFARSMLGVAALGLLLVGGCRSTTTDRMRVLEAERADLERTNSDLTHDLAADRAARLQAETEAERERARADAAEARAHAALSLNREPVAKVDSPGLLEKLKDTGVQVTPRDDGGAAIILASDVTFKSGRADLNKNAELILKRVASAVKSTDGVHAVRVEGHTDSDPIRKSGWKSNAELSLARAKTVRQYLVTQGVSQDDLSVAGLGASKPIDSNKTDAGKARNRRVVIILLARD